MLSTCTHNIATPNTHGRRRNVSSASEAAHTNGDAVTGEVRASLQRMKHRRAAKGLCKIGACRHVNGAVT